MEKYLKWAYYNPNSPAYLSAVDNVYRTVKNKHPRVTRKRVADWLGRQKLYQVHKPVRRRFERNRTKAIGFMTDWQCDLMDMGPAVGRANYKKRYVLVVIDILSRYLFAEPVKSKQPNDVVEGFKKILQKSKTKVWRVYHDNGTEFKGAFQKFLQDNDIQQLWAKNYETKAAVCERAIRTIRSRLGKYFTQHGTKRYLKILPKIISAINKSYHRSIKRRPVDVSNTNEQNVYLTLYGDVPTPESIYNASKHKGLKFKYKPGDFVRIARYKGKFDKESRPTFTNEIFIVHKQISRHPVAYSLTDQANEAIDGVFLEKELVNAAPPKRQTKRRRRS